jgi:hypothetical protein
MSYIEFVPKLHTFGMQNSNDRRILSRAAVFVVCVTLSIVTNAQTRRATLPSTRCSQPTIDRLEAESDGIRHWSTLHTFYHRYRACRVDDAEVTEGVSESVARLLADHWDTLPAAAKLFGQDPAFETFALAGINITDATEDLTRIDELATGHCAPALHKLCRKIRESVRTNN